MCQTIPETKELISYFDVMVDGKFDEDLKFYNDATIKVMVELYGNG